MTKLIEIAFVAVLILIGGLAKAANVDFCARSTEMRAALEKATKLPCKQITPETFSKITDVDVSLSASTLRKDDLAGLDQLITLDLELTNATEIPPGFFSSLGKVRDFDFTSKKLSKIDSKFLAPLKSVRGFKWRDPLLHELPVGIFSDLTELVSINLQELPLRTLEPSPFAHSPNLNVLQLPRDFKTVPESIFKGTHAESVSFGSTGPISAKVFNYAPHIDTADIYADYSKIKLENGHFFSDKKPNWVYLHGTNLKSLSPQFFDEIRRAKQINLFAKPQQLGHGADTTLSANGFTCQTIDSSTPHLMCINWNELRGENTRVKRQ
jgi:hypothetical protein